MVAGAGSIGCFVGGLLAATSHKVTLLGRPRILEEVAAHGLTLTDFGGLSCTVKAEDLHLTEDPAALSQADIVLVTVKTAATTAIAASIAQHARPGIPVVSLQNGLESAETLRRELPGHDVRPGMVPFNVVPGGVGRFHRATSGDIVIGDGPQDLVPVLSLPDLALTQSPQIEAVQWGKLLINLGNAPNALSGLSLQQQLLNPDWRRLLADQMAEALRVLRAHDVAVKPTTPVPAGLIPHILRLPTPLFRRIAASMLTIDPEARTSMAYDLMQGRATEIDALQGKIVELGAQKRIPTPINRNVAAAIKIAEQTGEVGISPQRLRE